ncbi:MAG TPA: histidine kinase [Nocardioides sp.]|uniref:sensor histidine kinase n=1 Tax=Nocardioides sp. TaxID=35761 RepID=UPI002E3012AD|nr:histidine kinase [Nocardioides sp.]HEX5087246.1 histidine kinase [Nocardioides sp.]
MSRRRATVIVAALLTVTMAAGLAGAWTDHLLRVNGRADLAGTSDYVWLFVVASVTAATVGAVIAVNHPSHPVGWLFLVLGVVISLAGPIDGYAAYALFAARDRPLPGGAAAAFVADREWMLWFLPIALILFLTPDGHYLSSRWRAAGRATVAIGALGLLLSIPSEQPFDAPFQDVANPFEVAGLQPAADLVKTVLVSLLGVGLIVSAVSLVVRFRRSRGEERRRMLWLVLVVLPMPVFVVLAYVASYYDHDSVTVVASAAFVTLVPIAAGLSVLRFRLYDVERIVATTVTWVLLSTILVAAYALMVWLGARAMPSGHVSPAAGATIGAVVAASLAFPLRRWLQDQADRRFNRRAYDARHLIGSALAAQGAGIDVEAVLREALADPTLTVAYPGGDGAWLRADGSPAASGVHIDVQRHDRVVARIGYDPEHTDADTVHRAAELAAAELDNIRLRAELAQRIEEIDASRRRLAAAQRKERRRIERDLHDGAQQQLLALAMDLQTARLNGDPERMRQALADGSDSARAAVRDLRALANGLHPAALADGGLTAALDDLARHSPVPLRLHVECGRLDPGTEFTAWSVIGEAVVNAQKHAGAHTIRVDVARENGHLRLNVCDDGHGGANPDGPGLRGLRDRIETARGRLSIVSGTAGTTLEAVLPCGS